MDEKTIHNNEPGSTYAQLSEMELSTTYLLMVDVDDFKTINEMFFLILNEVSRTLQTCY